jgi:predicted membrane protein DUF2238
MARGIAAATGDPRIAHHRYLTVLGVRFAILLFLCLPEIGAHYTYAEVPYDAWFKAPNGVTLNSLLGWERNNFGAQNPGSSSRNARSRSALAITLTDDSAIAAAATTGDSRSPKKG